MDQSHEIGKACRQFIDRYQRFFILFHNFFFQPFCSELKNSGEMVLNFQTWMKKKEKINAEIFKHLFSDLLKQSAGLSSLVSLYPFTANEMYQVNSIFFLGHKRFFDSIPVHSVKHKKNNVYFIPPLGIYCVKQHYCTPLLILYWLLFSVSAL